MSSSLPELLDHIVEKPDTNDLVLDGTKVGWYPERIAAWQRGEKIAPITMDVAWTRKCNYACVEGSQLISMADGTFKPIVEVLAGERVLSIAPDGSVSSSEVNKSWMNDPCAKTLQLRLLSSRLICTGNHPILTKQGWVRADELKAGEEVAIADVAPQSNERSYSRGEGRCHTPSAGGLQAVRRNVETIMGGGHKQAEETLSTMGASSNLRENAIKQSHETPRNCYERGVFKRTQSGPLEANEEGLEGWQNSTENYGPFKKQVGGETFAGTRESRLSLHRKWKSLDRQNTKRNPTESRLHLQKRETKDCLPLECDVLPSERGIAENGTGGLPFGRLEGVDFLGDKSRLQLASPDCAEGGEHVCQWQKIIAIEPGPDSAVYDLECYPHHNFVASGIVVHNCEFCYATMQASKGREITREIALQFLEDAAEIGVKGVSLISDGESSIVPFYAESIEHGAKHGLQIGIGTNGKVLKRAILERILPYLSYMRFNFSGGTREGYSRIMGVKPEWYDIVIQNIKDAMQIKHRDNLGVTINMQLVCDPKNEAELLPFAALAASIRPDYAIIKHCADDVDHTLGTDYTQYEKLNETFDKIEAMGDATFRVIVKRDRMKDEGKRDYSKCYGPPFITQMSGNGLIAPCGFLFNEKYKAFHIGNICDTRFRDIFASDRYTEVMRYLASDEFDPRSRCGPNCLQTQTNSFLFKYVNGKVALPTAPPPPHMGFL